MYEIDTEAEATVQASLGSAAESTTSEPAKPAVVSSPSPVAAKAPAASPSTAKSAEQSRAPSIHFLGRDGWKKKLAGVPVLPPVPKNFGRPIFTAEEMEALLSGGANLRVQ